MSRFLYGILVFVLAIALWLGGSFVSYWIISEADEIRHNGGYCQNCGDDVEVIGHSHYNDYYCPTCKTFNK